MIYLDHNSTTPLAPEAAAAMAEWQTGKFGNPASQHAIGRRARQAIEEARDEIGRILGARRDGRTPDRVIFTSGGTEANNLALLGITGCFQPHVEPGEVVISAIEHPSVTAPAELLERLGWVVHRLPVSGIGEVEVAALNALLSDRTRLVSVMLANNETGVLQPVAELAAVCRTRAIPLHTDAVQAVGKLPVDFRQLEVSALTLAAHKFNGPLGIGALIVRHDVQLHPLLVGGFQQEGYRGGTESVALAVGMQAALAAWEKERQAREVRMRELRDRLETKLAQAFGPQLIVVGSAAERLPHISNAAILGIDRQALVMALDLAGVACSSGSACASGSSEPSPVLQAMGCDAAILNSAVRFSLGANTSPAEIDGAVQKVVQIVDQMRARQASTSA